MRSSAYRLALRNVVGKTLHAFLIAVIPLHRAFGRSCRLFRRTRRRFFFVQRRFFAVHVLHEAGHAAGKGEAFVSLPSRSSVNSMSTPLLRKESSRIRLARVSKLYSALPKVSLLARSARLCLLVGIADNLQQLFGFATYEADEVFFAVTVDGQRYPQSDSALTTDTPTPIPAAEICSCLSNLPPAYQTGHDDFGGGRPLLRVDAGRHAAAVVGHADGIVSMDGYGDFVAMSASASSMALSSTSNTMVQAAAVLRVADPTLPGRLRTASSLPTPLHAVGAVFFVFWSVMVFSC